MKKILERKVTNHYVCLEPQEIKVTNTKSLMNFKGRKAKVVHICSATNFVYLSPQWFAFCACYL